MDELRNHDKWTRWIYLGDGLVKIKEINNARQN